MKASHQQENRLKDKNSYCSYKSNVRTRKQGNGSIDEHMAYHAQVTVGSLPKAQTRRSNSSTSFLHQCNLYSNENE